MGWRANINHKRSKDRSGGWSYRHGSNGIRGGYNLKIRFKTIKNKEMDMEKPLKFDGEYFCIDTDSDMCDPLALRGCMGTLWPSDCDHEKIYTEQIVETIDKIKCYADLAQTPLDHLVALARQEPGFTQYGEDQLRRILRKSKLIQKRERAKKRCLNPQPPKLILPPRAGLHFAESGEDMKKQKNRLSAQISRDRKKEHINKVQGENLQLKQKIQKLQLENKKLSEQVSLSKSLNDSFQTFLIFLGLAFLMELITGLGFTRRATSKESTPSIVIGMETRCRVQSEMSRFGLSHQMDQLQGILANKEKRGVPDKLGRAIEWAGQHYL